MLQYQKLAQGITCIDAQLYGPNLTCFYLIESAGELAFIETGHAHAAPVAIALLKDMGYRPEQVRYIIPTHVHLDHAGAAGILHEQCPNARLLAHPKGARHLIDPSRLWAGAEVVYGREKLLETFGQIQPADSSRVVIVDDGDSVELGNRALEIRHTPGHAAHHLCIWDDQSRGWFSGDTFGFGYAALNNQQFPFLIPPTSPVQFNPQQYIASIELLLSYNPECIYLTHYGLIKNALEASKGLIGLINSYCEIAQQSNPGENQVDNISNAITDFTLDKLMDYGSPLDREAARQLIVGTMGLAAQGLAVWLNQDQ